MPSNSPRSISNYCRISSHQFGRRLIPSSGSSNQNVQTIIMQLPKSEIPFENQLALTSSQLENLSISKEENSTKVQIMPCTTYIPYQQTNGMQQNYYSNRMLPYIKPFKVFPDNATLPPFFTSRLVGVPVMAYPSNISRFNGYPFQFRTSFSSPSFPFSNFTRLRSVCSSPGPNSSWRPPSTSDFVEVVPYHPSLEKDQFSCDKEGIKAAVNNLRYWQSVSSTNQAYGWKSSIKFTVMSYNILSQDLIDDNSYLYKHCKPQHLDWKNRRLLLVEQLEEADAQIVCLQEVQADHYEDFLHPQLTKLGYKSVYKKRTGNKPDGCAIFYKKSDFLLDSWSDVEYYHPGVRILDRDNVGIVAVLKTRQDPSTKICVANTHLLYNPRRGDIKLAQLAILFAEIDRLVFRRFSWEENPQYHPVIICGDLNASPHSDLIRFINDGSLRYDGLQSSTISAQYSNGSRKGNVLGKQLIPECVGVSDSCQHLNVYMDRIAEYYEPDRVVKLTKAIDKNKERVDRSNTTETEISENEESVDKNKLEVPTFGSGLLSHKLNLSSVYWPKQGEITTHNVQPGAAVDYIFYSSVRGRNANTVHRISKGPLLLLSNYSLLTEEHVLSLGGLPNAGLPSDHIPLMAKFMLKCN